MSKFKEGGFVDECVLFGTGMLDRVPENGYY